MFEIITGKLLACHLSGHFVQTSIQYIINNFLWIGRFLKRVSSMQRLALTNVCYILEFLIVIFHLKVAPAVA